MTGRFKLVSALLSLIFLYAACSTPGFAPNAPAGYKAKSGKEGLQSGPMLGYCDMFEVLVWVQTKGYATVQVDYWEPTTPAVKYHTEKISTQAPAYTAKCIANQVQPGRTYDYQVRINGVAVNLPYPTTFKTQALWQWRTDPPPFTFVAGSCFYINESAYDRPKPYGSNYQIVSKIYDQKPDFMLWLGDNVYFREPDWFTKTGMVHRYTHGRSLPELQPLLASTAHYAIWDDHDFGPNDADGSWINKEMSWETFQEFWGNPTFGLDGKKGCTTMFSYNDADFFLLDNRYYRTPNRCKTCERSSLGKDQMEWLIGALTASRAQFKFIAIGGEIITSDDHDETAFHDFPAERDTLLSRIEREGIKGVVFLTGDRHFSELSGMKNNAGNWIYDLTSSSLTAGAYTSALEKSKNEYRIPGTVTAENNFCVLKLSGPFRQRTLTITNFNAQGKEMWTKSILPDYSCK